MPCITVIECKTSHVYTLWKYDAECYVGHNIALPTSWRSGNIFTNPSGGQSWEITYEDDEDDEVLTKSAR